MQTSTSTDSVKRSLANRTHEALREAIIEGRLRPNERLVEAELAERFNVSRTPLRESLARLAGEGLIMSRRQGWVVREHTHAEIREIYEVRAALEGFAARLAAERATDEQLERIASITAAHDRDLLVQPRRALVEVNDAFHEAIVEAAANERLHVLLGQNRRFFFNHRVAELFTEEEARESLQGHDRVVAAFLEGDPERAEASMRDHVFHSMHATLAKVR